MASFHNTSEVRNQVANQYVYGDVHHWEHGHTTQVRKSHTSRNDLDIEESLDSDILASLAYPEMFYRRVDIRAPYRTTCQWIFQLEEYITWTSQPSGLLWIKGKPGAGKSTLMAHLYHAMREDAFPNQTICLEFFFTARGTPLQRTKLGMLRSLSSQIFHQDMSVRTVLRRSYREKQALFGHTHRVWEWRQPELERLLIECVLASAKRRPLIVFVDALDEAGTQTAREMAHYFHNLNDRLHQQAAISKIYISCRHYPTVPKFHAVEIWVERHNQSDIAAYVRGRLNARALSSDTAHNGAEWEAFVQNLIDAANGVFQWVCLIVPIVEDLILKGHSLQYTRKWLTQVPEELGQVYKYIVEQLMIQSHRTKSYQLFQWVCLATRPLSVAEIRCALASHDALSQPHVVKHNDSDDFVDAEELMTSRIRSWSGGLIEVATGAKGERTVVQPIHQSVNDFLLAEGLEVLTRLDSSRQDLTGAGTVDPLPAEIIARWHGELYWCCLSYMSKDAARFLSFPYEKDLDRHRRAKEGMRNEFPLLVYASSSCVTHAEKALRSRNLATEKRMLEAAIPVWMRAASMYELEVAYLKQNATPLHVAAAADRIDLAYYLLECGVDVDAADVWGQTALHLAARRGHITLAKILVQNKANVHKETRRQSTPLMLAAGRGHVDVVSWLLGEGASLEVDTPYNGTVLYAAAQSGSLVITKLCIEAGIEVNVQEGHHGNALKAASHEGHDKIVQALLDAGADVNARGGRTTLYALQAASYRGRERVVQVLLDAGADVNAQGGGLGNALQAAISEGHERTVQILLRAGANVNAQGGRYGNALQAASLYGYDRIVQLLLKSGADVNAQGGKFGNALQAASWYGHDRTLQALLDAEAEVDAQGEYGTALQAASYRGHESIVRALLRAGAEVNALGGKYGTALQVASSRGHDGIAQILSEAEAGAHIEERRQLDHVLQVRPEQDREDLTERRTQEPERKGK